MIRYTIEIIANSAGMDITTIRKQLENSLSRVISLYKIRFSDQILDKGLILLETDLPSSKLLGLMEKLRSDSNVRTIEARWGWIIPSDTVSRARLNERENDPFFYTIPIPDIINKDGFYTYSLVGKIYLLINFILLFLGIGILYFGYSSSEKIPTWFGLFFSCIFAFATLNILSNIKCDNVRIVFRYLFKPTVIMNWPEINTLKIFQARGEWCAIYGINQKIDLPLSRIFDKTSQNRLLKSIIVNANLCFVESSSDGIIYKQSNIIR